MNVPFFGHLDTKQLSTAAALASFVHFEKGEVIFRQGDMPHAFYVVTHGAVTVSTLFSARPMRSLPCSERTM